MNEIIYLKDGRKAALIEKVGSKYVVAPYYEYENCTGGAYEDTGEEILVNEVFKLPPRAIFNGKIAALKRQIKDLDGERDKLALEVSQLKGEVTELKGTKTNLSRLIINREELLKADRITAIKDFEAIDLNKKSGYHSNQYGFSLSIGFCITEGKLTYETSRLEEDGRGWGIYIDRDIGLLINKTDEEIKDVLRNKVANVTVTDADLIYNLADDLLTPELVARKAKLVAKESEEKAQKLRQEIEAKTKELNDLTKKP